LELAGVFSDNYSDLLKLKGVGEYTAAAIASFSYNEVVPLWTGMFQVLSRYFDVETDIAGFCQKSLQLWLSIDAKRQSCLLTGDYGVRCFAMRT
jgi:adenine-specific DNA glycosylase